MITYKDMTFCKFYTSCRKGKTCPKALTNQVKKDAKNEGMWISKFVDIPSCYREKKWSEKSN